MVWIVNDPKLTGAAVVFGALIALFVTGLSSRLIDWFSARDTRPRERRETQGDSLRLPGAGRHAGDSPQISDRRRIRQDVRKLV